MPRGRAGVLVCVLGDGDRYDMVYVWSCTWREENHGVSPDLPYCLTQGLFVVPYCLNQAICPTSSWGFSYLCLPSLHMNTRIIGVCYHAHLYVSSGDSNSGPHDCIASTFPLIHPPSPVLRFEPSVSVQLVRTHLTAC